MNFRVLEKKAELLAVLAHPTRLAILQTLKNSTRCVSDIQELLDIHQPNLSQHLLLLKQAGIIDCCRKGQFRCYYVCKPTMVDALMEFLSGKYPTKIPDDISQMKPKKVTANS